MLTAAKTHISVLSTLVGAIAKNDGDYNTPIRGLRLYRRGTATVPMPCVYGLGLGIAVQGGKRVTLGEEVFDYGPGQTLVAAVDLPVVSHVTRASADEPFLGIYLDLDARVIAQLAAEIDLPKSSKRSAEDSIVRAMRVVAMDEGLLDAVIRLLRVLDEPSLLPQIAPLIQREIIVRLLSGQHGPMLRHLVAVGSPSQQIAKVMSWLKLHFTEALMMDDLADRAHMSSSTFRQHFRAVAGMSPLQYLKNLRLQEARQLMLNEHLDAGSAAMRVGYESASQFSREYSRLFGEPPQRDVRRMKENGMLEELSAKPSIRQRLPPTARP